MKSLPTVRHFRPTRNLIHPPSIPGILGLFPAMVEQFNQTAERRKADNTVMNNLPTYAHTFADGK